MRKSLHQWVNVGSAVLIVVASATASWADIINIPADQPTIQAGIDAAGDGDVVVVAPGTYLEAINFIGKAIMVTSSGGAAVTTIDGGGAFHVVKCVSGEGPGSVLNGFTITGGNADGGFPDDRGGGMSNHNNSSPTLANCTFTGNTGIRGGGMSNYNGSSPTVTSCTFSGNTAADFGGGMHNQWSSPTIDTCDFLENMTTFGDGGGMLNYSGAPTVTGCTFIGNTSAADGGGMANAESSAIVNNCDFQGNVANYSGGGMSSRGPSSPVVTSCTFSGNVATNFNGGGMLCASAASPTVIGCTFSQNTTNFDGGGVACFDRNTTANLVNCTIANNSAGLTGGLFSYETMTTVANCVVWDNTPGQIAHGGSGTTTVSYSDVEGGYSGTGNVDRDPQFVDLAGGDLRLGMCSAVADAGNNSSVPRGVTTDLDGNPRFVDDAGVADTGFGDPPVVDMGAYERQTDSPGGITHVPADYATIQGAIDAICDGEVVVAPGTYFESINFNGKAITVRSTDPANPDVVAGTIIDGGASGSVVICASGEGPDTQLSGFTITNGNATDGGGMRNVGANPTVTNCTFSGNSANLGGGMYNNGSSPTVTNCTFSRNIASGLDGGGGGMFNHGDSSPTVTNCTFNGNTADYGGGGIQNQFSSNPTVTDCTFSENTATLKGGGMFNFISSPTVTNCTFSGNVTGDQGDGGGMYNELVSNPTVANCTFSGNTAEFAGGGMFNSGSDPTVTDCTFSENTAAVGGGMMNLSGSSPTVTNCVFRGNTGTSTGGGGMSNWYDSSPTVINCTFTGNTAGFSGGAMYNYFNTSNPTVTNCIFWNNVPNEIADDVGSATTASYSNISGGFAGVGNIDADPLFIDPDNGNLRLQAGSPCIDAGDNTAVPADIKTDLDGNPRFVDDRATADTGIGFPCVDMGAYEFQIETCPADISVDGVVGPADLAIILGNWGPVPPNDPIADLNGNGVVGPADLAILLGTWGPCPK